MERRFYTARSLKHALGAFETHFGMESASFYKAHSADSDRVAAIPRRHRNLWASLYRDWRRLSGEDFAEEIERELEYA